MSFDFRDEPFVLPGDPNSADFLENALSRVWGNTDYLLKLPALQFKFANDAPTNSGDCLDTPCNDFMYFLDNILPKYVNSNVSATGNTYYLHGRRISFQLIGDFTITKQINFSDGIVLFYGASWWGGCSAASTSTNIVFDATVQGRDLVFVGTGLWSGSAAVSIEAVNTVSILYSYLLFADNVVDRTFINTHNLGITDIGVLNGAEGLLFASTQTTTFSNVTVVVDSADTTVMSREGLSGRDPIKIHDFLFQPKPCLTFDSHMRSLVWDKGDFYVATGTFPNYSCSLQEYRPCA